MSWKSSSAKSLSLALRLTVCAALALSTAGRAAGGASPDEPPTPAPVPPAPPPAPPADTRLSPAQRKSLREHPELAVAPKASSAPAVSPAPVAAPGPHEDVVAMSPLRKRIAERLVQAQHTAAILTTFNEVDMTAVMALRKQFGEEFQKTHGCKLGFMSFFVKAAVAALQKFPGLNAEVRGDAIVYKKHYDIGIAVGGGKGLVVPVLRGADRLGFAEIERGINELAQKATASKLTLEELSGGTFSITNGGIYGSMMSTPLLNMPQTGILGMHNIVKRAVVVGDEVVVRPMMYLAVSYDHRVVDGREAVQFLVALKERLEAPDRLLFSL